MNAEIAARENADVQCSSHCVNVEPQCTQSETRRSLPGFRNAAAAERRSSAELQECVAIFLILRSTEVVAAADGRAALNNGKQIVAALKEVTP